MVASLFRRWKSKLTSYQESIILFIQSYWK